MARGWTITAFALATLLSTGLVRAQSIIEPDPPAKGQPAAKPPAKKQPAGGPAREQALPGKPQEVPPPIQAVADVASMNFIDEHPMCAAYFSVAGGCLADSDPEKAKMTILGQVLMQRALSYERQYKLPAGSLKAKAEEAQKGMAAKVWHCASASLVLDDFKIPCRALAEEPEARMRQHMLDAADQVGKEIQAAQQKQPPQQAPAAPPKR